MPIHTPRVVFLTMDHPRGDCLKSVALETVAGRDWRRQRDATRSGELVKLRTKDLVKALETLKRRDGIGHSKGSASPSATIRQLEGARRHF